MTIENPPFVRTKLDEEERQDTFTVKLNADERKQFDALKEIIREPKDSTAIKQLSLVVAPKVLNDHATAAILDLAVNNYRRARRSGRIGERDI